MDLFVCNPSLSPTKAHSTCPLGDFVISTVGHGEANGEKPFAPVGTSGARAFQAYSTAPTDTWAFLVVEGYDERRRASLVIFSLTQNYRPQTLNWLRS